MANTHEQLDLNAAELELLAELLEAERDRLLIGIRHTDRRVFRDELRQRLDLVETLAERCGSKMAALL